jgi:DNA-binding beta-propeller fold protein YncE
MRTKIFLLLGLAFITVTANVNAQHLIPKLIFKDNPGTHNVHICTDGKFFYTVNGGKKYEGKISKFDKKGNLLSEYPIELDMRGIMYNNKDGYLYVNSYDRNIYKITDLENGSFSIYFEEFYSNDQAGLALDPKGEKLYYLDMGTLRIYDFNTGELKNTYYNIKCGPTSFDGGAVVAVGKKFVYTWNAVDQEIYLFDQNLKYLKTIKVTEGDYGFSLSYTKKYVFVSEDGDYDVGTWYGYKIK